MALAALTVAGGAYGLSKLGQGAAAIAEGAITQLPNAGATPQMPPNVPTGMQPQQPQAPQAPPQPGPLSAQGIPLDIAISLSSEIVFRISGSNASPSFLS